MFQFELNMIRGKQVNKLGKFNDIKINNVNRYLETYIHQGDFQIKMYVLKCWN